MARWIDNLAMHWLGRRHGWPVRAGLEFFYEPDQPVEEIEQAWEKSAKGFTTSMGPVHGIDVTESGYNVVIRGNWVSRGDL